MKFSLSLLILCLAWMPGRLSAQNAAADAALERKANEERFTRLNATVANVLDTQEVLQQRLSELEKRLHSLGQEINKLKDDSSRANTRQVTREEFSALVEKLKEIDKKREEDKKLILETIKDLAKVPVPAPTHPKPSVETSDVGETVDYIVKKDEFLYQIIAAYNELYAKQGRGRITLEQVKKANPDLNPNKIREGQPIRIPVPAKK